MALNINLIKTSQTPSPTLNLGDMITYNIAIQNTGTITITNAVLLDTIPICLTFVLDSLKINGTTIPAVTPSPPAGAVIGVIVPGSTSNISFKAQLATTPCSCMKTYNREYIQNDSTLIYNYNSNTQFGASYSNSIRSYLNCIGPPQVSLIKSASPPAVKSGDTITYTCGIINHGAVTITNVFFSDTIPTCTTFVSNSVTVNGGAVAGTPVPPSSVPVGTIGPGSVSTITFQVRFDCSCPHFISPIKNTATIRYNYTLPPSLPNSESGSANSNTVETPAVCGNLEMEKSADHTKVGNKEQFRFNIDIKNNSTATANNVVFFDTLPICTTIATTTTCSSGIRVNGICISGASLEPPHGVPIGSISPDQTATVTIDLVTVDDFCDCMKRNNKNNIDNSSTTTYVYTVDPSLPNFEQGSANSNTVIVDKDCPGH